MKTQPWAIHRALCSAVTVPPQCTNCRRLVKQLYRDTLGVILGGPTTGMIPVDLISLCENFIIVLHTIVFIFGDLNCISICKLNRFFVDLSSETLIRCREIALPCGGPFAEIGRPWYRLVSVMGYPIMLGWHLFVEPFLAVAATDIDRIETTFCWELILLVMKKMYIASLYR